MKKVDKARGEDVRPKRHMTWEEYGRLEKKLVEAVISRLTKEQEHVDMVIGIFRGGLVIARSFASQLGEVPLVIIHPRKGTPARIACLADEDINSIPEERRARMTVLLVDDISDTGRTFQGMRQCLEDIKFHRVFTGALVLKSYAAFVPDFFAEKDETTDWIVFPWEACQGGVATA
jgi:hypoxanthine phosphoribosyltransferase